MMQEEDGTEPARPADGADRTLDVLRFERDPLRAIFAPKSVAVIGATEKEGTILSHNVAMQHVSRKAGFNLERIESGGSCRAGSVGVLSR